MAKQAEDNKEKDLDKRYPYKETLLIHDKETGSIKAVSGIKENGGYSTTDTLAENAPAFFDVKSTNPLLNWYRNLKQQWTDPTKIGPRFAVYRVPFGKVPELSQALHNLHNDPKDDVANYVANKYRISARQMEKIKIDRQEFPFEHLQTIGISKDAVFNSPHLDKMEQGLVTPADFTVRFMVGDRGLINDKFSLQFYQDMNQQVNFEVKPPLGQPEYLQEQWRQYFGANDHKAFQAGQTIDRLISMPDERTGEFRKCYVAFDTSTNRFIPQPANEVHARLLNSDFVMGVRVNPTQKEMARNGEPVYLEGCKRWKDGPEFSGNVQYDVKNDRWECYAPRYKYPQIPEHLANQLSPEDTAKLRNYERIDGTQYKNKEGQPYRGDISINRDSNEPRWHAPSQQQQQEQSQSRGRTM